MRETIHAPASKAPRHDLFFSSSPVFRSANTRANRFVMWNISRARARVAKNNANSWLGEQRGMRAHEPAYGATDSDCLIRSASARGSAWHDFGTVHVPPPVPPR